MGEALGRWLELGAHPKHGESSLTLQAYRNSTPVTVHVAIGTDTPHTHPAADGTFDGRWLVWSALRGFDAPSISAVWSWDSRTGRLQKVGAAHQAPSSDRWSGSAAVVRDGLVTWTRSAGPSGLSDVHVFDLASGRDRVVHRGYVDDSFLVNGGLVVWSEAAKRGGSTVMSAADARSGEPVAVPPSLAGLRNVAAPATDGAAIAAEQRRLFAAG